MATKKPSWGRWVKKSGPGAEKPAPAAKKGKKAEKPAPDASE